MNASDATWKYFTIFKNISKKGYVFTESSPLTIQQATQWRLWMKTVFQPINLQIEKIITENTQLVIGNEMPAVFSDMIAHTEGYKAVMTTWTEDDKKKRQIHCRIQQCRHGVGLSAEPERMHQAKLHHFEEAPGAPTEVHDVRPFRRAVERSRRLRLLHRHARKSDIAEMNLPPPGLEAMYHGWEAMDARASTDGLGRETALAE